MKGDKFDFYVSSYYQAAATSAPLTSPLLDIVNGLSSGVSGSSVLNTHGVTNAQLQTAFTPNVTSFLNTQPPYTTGSTVPLAYVNWVLFDEQFNLVRSTSSFERVSAAGVIEMHVRTGIPITQSGYLYIYVSNTTPNIPVYFDNLKVKHIRGALLETNEFYPYGLKMANISYKSASTITNRYGWNGGNEYEDEGELNYSNTFFRKYDAQIGKFTGIDMYAEKYAGINPYQFGANNPVMFNDPMGDRLKGLSEKGPDGNYHVGWWSEFMWRNVGFLDWGADVGAGGGGGDAGGGLSSLRNMQGISAQQIINNMLPGFSYGKNKKGEYGFFSTTKVTVTAPTMNNTTVTFSSKVWSGIKSGYADYIYPGMVWVNQNINPINPFVELATGKELGDDGYYTKEKSRVQSGSESVIAVIPFGKIVGAGGKVLLNTTVNKSLTMTADQIALKSLVNEATLGGRKALIQSEANAAMQMATEVNYPGFRASLLDLGRINNHWIGGPHFHMPGIGSGHIPIIFP
jgi:RHS repeat-associated protein